MTTADVVKALEDAGAMMANVLFNLKQRPGYVLSDSDRQSMSEAQEAWDAARRSAHVAQPAPAQAVAVDGWEIDQSAGSPILTYEKCSVIQDEQAFYVLDTIKGRKFFDEQFTALVNWAAAAQGEPDLLISSWRDAMERAEAAEDRSAGYLRGILACHAELQNLRDSYSAKETHPATVTVRKALFEAMCVIARLPAAPVAPAPVAEPGGVTEAAENILIEGDTTYSLSTDAMSTLMAHGLLSSSADGTYRLATEQALRADPGSVGVNHNHPKAVLAVVRAALQSSPQGWRASLTREHLDELGYVIVPKAATFEMRDAAWNKLTSRCIRHFGMGDILAIYDAMLAASPTPPEQAAPGKMERE